MKILSFPSAEIAEAEKVERKVKKLIQSGFLQVVEVSGNPHFMLPLARLAEWIDKGTVNNEKLKGEYKAIADRIIVATFDLVMSKGTEYAINGEELEEFFLNRLAAGEKNFYDWKNRQIQKMAKQCIKAKCKQK